MDMPGNARPSRHVPLGSRDGPGDEPFTQRSRRPRPPLRGPPVGGLGAVRGAAPAPRRRG
jgi:hypothetical protein